MPTLEISLQQGPFFQTTTLTWWQKLLAVLSVCATLVLAAVIGVLLLYVLFFILGIALVIGAGLYIRYRFFPPRRSHSTRRTGPDNITIIETPDGVVVDVSVDNQDKEQR